MDILSQLLYSAEFLEDLVTGGLEKAVRRTNKQKLDGFSSPLDLATFIP